MEELGGWRERHPGEAVKGGAVAGLIAGAVIAVYALVAAAAHGQSAWVEVKTAAFPFFHRRALAPGFDAAAVALGVLAHFAVSVGWGILFGLVAREFPRAAIVGIGALWGFVVWIGMFYVVLPLVGADAVVADRPMGQAVLEHVLFGLALGAAFALRQRALPPHEAWWRLRAERPGPA